MRNEFNAQCSVPYYFRVIRGYTFHFCYLERPVRFSGSCDDFVDGRAPGNPFVSIRDFRVDFAFGAATTSSGFASGANVFTDLSSKMIVS